jgi:hypothetical protein
LATNYLQSDPSSSYAKNTICIDDENDDNNATNAEGIVKNEQVAIMLVDGIGKSELVPIELDASEEEERPKRKEGKKKNEKKSAKPKKASKNRKKLPVTEKKKTIALDSSSEEENFRSERVKSEVDVVKLENEKTFDRVVVDNMKTEEVMEGLQSNQIVDAPVFSMFSFSFFLFH